MVFLYTYLYYLMIIIIVISYAYYTLVLYKRKIIVKCNHITNEVYDTKHPIVYSLMLGCDLFVQSKAKLHFVRVTLLFIGCFQRAFFFHDDASSLLYTKIIVFYYLQFNVSRR